MADWTKYLHEIISDERFVDAAIVDYKKNKIITTAPRTLAKILPGQINLLTRGINLIKINLSGRYYIIYRNSLMEETDYTMELLTADHPVSPVAISRSNTALFIVVGKPTTHRKAVSRTARKYADIARSIAF